MALQSRETGLPQNNSIMENSCIEIVICEVVKNDLCSAIKRNDLIWAQILLEEQGVDVDVCKLCSSQPLHTAIMCDNKEAICMLLCYGADVSIPSGGITPLEYAFLQEDYNLIEILHDYYIDDDFFNCLLTYCAKNYTELINVTALQNNQPGKRIDPATINIDSIKNWTPIFMEIFEHKSFHLFKILLSRVTSNILRNMKQPLLYTFFLMCNFSPTLLLEYCYLILDSSMGFNVVQQLNTSFCYLWDLLEAIDNSAHPISQNDRLCLIYTLLMLGMQITLKDIVYIFNTNGYNKELMALVYGGFIKKIPHSQKSCLLPITNFIWVLEENASMKTVSKMFRNSLTYSFSDGEEYNERFLYFLGFFSFSTVVKEELIRLCKIHLRSNEKIVAKLKITRSVPSLLELSRNRTVQFIKKKYKIKQAYQFHDIVKNLNVPKHIKNIIIFRTPIYD